jgi:hypothetical protein
MRGSLCMRVGVLAPGQTLNECMSAPAGPARLLIPASLKAAGPAQARRLRSPPPLTASARRPRSPPQLAAPAQARRPRSPPALQPLPKISVTAEFGPRFSDSLFFLPAVVSSYMVKPIISWHQHEAYQALPAKIPLPSHLLLEIPQCCFLLDCQHQHPPSTSTGHAYRCCLSLPLARLFPSQNRARLVEHVCIVPCNNNKPKITTWIFALE